ncbi:putative BolA protein [Helianthus annuus]|nr:putative BolA protein [Helianthus annuus]
MSLCSSYRRISTHFIPLPPSIFKPLNPKPPSSFPISPKPHLSKSFTVRSTPTTKPSSPDPNLHHSNNQNLIFEQLPQNLQQIIKLFQSVQDPKAKYEQLLFYGKNLKPLEPQFKTDENKVKGCVSQVWLRAYFDDSDKKVVIFEADSDALITKGLSPSRNNGFLNMFQLMQKKALLLFVEAEKGSVSRTENVESPKADSDSGSRASDFELSNSSSTVDVSSSDGLVLGSRGQRIREILNKELQPVELELEDVSYQHAGHAGVKGSSNGETHFNLRVVSKEFEGKSMVKRHRLVYSLLANELQSGLHALSIEAKTPAEVGR